MATSVAVRQQRSTKKVPFTVGDIEAAWNSLLNESPLPSDYCKSIEHLRIMAQLFVLLRALRRCSTTNQRTALIESSALHPTNAQQLLALTLPTALPRTMHLPRPQLPTILNIDWRINVAISSRHLKQLLQPFVHLRLHLSDGRAEDFELTLAKFHSLRHQLALMLRNVHNIEKKWSL